jgi:hypothetical protein
MPSTRNTLEHQMSRHNGYPMSGKDNLGEALAFIGMATAVGVPAFLAHEKHVRQNHPQPTPIEKVGDHHGSAGMPSQEHLQKFADEHRIQLNQK